MALGIEIPQVGFKPDRIENRDFASLQTEAYAHGAGQMRRAICNTIKPLLPLTPQVWSGGAEGQWHNLAQPHPYNVLQVCDFWQAHSPVTEVDQKLYWQMYQAGFRQIYFALSSIFEGNPELTQVFRQMQPQILERLK